MAHASGTRVGSSRAALDAPRSRANPSGGPARLTPAPRSTRRSTAAPVSEFPCDKFVEMFDPNDPEGRRSAVYRAGIEAYRARHGDEKAVELIRKTAKAH